MPAKKLTPEEILELGFWAREFEPLKARFLAPPNFTKETHGIEAHFNEVFKRAVNLPCYDLAFGSWVRVFINRGKTVPLFGGDFVKWLKAQQAWLESLQSGDSPHETNVQWLRENFVHIFRIGGDELLGNGDAEAGRKKRLDWMAAAHKHGYLAGVRKLQNLQQNQSRKPQIATADKTWDRIISGWLPLSFWAMDDKSAHYLAYYGAPAEEEIPNEKAWRELRRVLGLATWRELRISRKPLLRFDPSGLHFTPRSEVGQYYLGE